MSASTTPVGTAPAPTQRRPRRRWAVALCVSVTLLSVGCAARDEGAAERPQAARAPTWPLSGQAPAVTSEKGLVVSGHPLASRVGAQVLADGGNAIDAAVATGFALAVVLPEAGNIGGGGFLVHRSASGEVKTLDFREKAPAAASRDMYLDQAGQPTDRGLVGHLATGVPGSVAGLWSMHQELGSLPWDRLLAPAIELARAHQIDQTRHDNLIGAQERLSRFDASAAKFVPGGSVPAEGSTWRQPELAKTLETIRDHGRDGFYRGTVAELIVAEMKRGSGIVTLVDLAAYQPVWREPIEVDYRGYQVFSMPPPSSGGITLGLILNVLEGTGDLAAMPPIRRLHFETEAMRRSFIERNLYLGDPDFVDMPLERLRSQEYADQLREAIDPEHAGVTPVDLFEPVESNETTHYSVVDAAGNAVAITTTLNSSFGSGVTVAGAGFLLNNEMDDFAAAPGKPNQFGLVEGENNAIAPNKRMLSSMTPTVVVAPDGKLFMVVGSPGGPTIITSVFQVISNVIDLEMDLRAAVEAPRIHHQALPDVLFFEPGGLDPDERAGLEALGHSLRERSEYSGDVNAILRHDRGFVGVADPRRGSGPAAADGQ